MDVLGRKHIVRFRGVSHCLSGIRRHWTSLDEACCSPCTHRIHSVTYCFKYTKFRHCTRRPHSRPHRKGGCNRTSADDEPR